MTWKIKDWDKHFENSRSRNIEKPSWVAMPNRHDSRGLAIIAKHPKRCEIFTVWVLAVQLASKMPKRGILIDGDRELTFDDMALKTRFPKKLFETWLPWLEKEVGWISQTVSDRSLSSPCDPDDTEMEGKCVGREGKKEQKEQKEGKEGIGKEGQTPPPGSPPSGPSGGDDLNTPESKRAKQRVAELAGKSVKHV